MKAEQHPAMLSQCCQLPSAGLHPGEYCQPVGVHIPCIRVEGVGGSRGERRDGDMQVDKMGEGDRKELR